MGVCSVGVSAGSADMNITREWAMPNRWTFTIAPIKKLLDRYVGDGTEWIDPFCGTSTLAAHRNDLDPTIKGCSHKLALDFVKEMTDQLNGILFDPPYSGRQVSECYTHLKQKVHMDDTSSYFYWSVKREVAPKIKPGGYAISFGWNSSGFGGKLGFEIIEILLICHGSNHNDTIVTVERKMNKSILIPPIIAQPGGIQPGTHNAVMYP